MSFEVIEYIRVPFNGGVHSHAVVLVNGGTHTSSFSIEGVYSGMESECNNWSVLNNADLCNMVFATEQSAFDAVIANVND